MKIAVIGSRNFDDYDFFSNIISEYITNKKRHIIVSGAAKGTDSLARRYAEEHDFKIIEIKPEWSTFGRSAASLRNKEIVNISEKIIAFWDGESKGTKQVIELGQFYNKRVIVILVPKNNIKTNFNNTKKGN